MMSGLQIIQQAAAPRPSPTEIEMTAPVVEVTLLEDRAQVVRRGRVALPAGSVRVRVAGLAPVLGDKTLGGTVLSGPSGTRLFDLRLQRAPYLERTERPQDLEELEAQIRDAEEQLAMQRQELTLLEGELQLLRETTRRTLQDILVDAGWNRAQPEQWQEHVTRLLEREQQLRATAIDQRFVVEQGLQQLGDLRARRRELQRPNAQLKATLLADLVVATAGVHELGFRYVVPGACWRPHHRARLVRSGDGDRVMFEMEGCAWQNTGEDWCDVAVHFSTARPSLGTEPPLLADDVLVGQRRQEATVVETREQEIVTTGLGPATRTADDLPGIDDGGTPVLLEGREKATVKSDGRPCRVPILRFESEAETGLVVTAELAAAAILRCTLVNRAPRALLAGPVDLIADSGLVGRTSMLYVAPGERFALGFGPDPTIRVRRQAEQLEQKSPVLGRWVHTDHHIMLYLSNIGSEQRRLELLERVPVSEVEAVRVLFDREKSTPAGEPDADGLLRWSEELPAGANRTIHLRYALEKKKEVVGV